jgi:hypothetical protein
MGGFGSGRQSTRTSVEQCRVLDASRWTREGLLRIGTVQSGLWQWTDADTGQVRSSIGFLVDTFSGRPSLRLTYTFTNTGERVDYNVKLQATRPNFGGLRWWFICPLLVNGKPCGRRVQKLFMPSRGRYYGCRHCHDLTYTSRRQDAKDRTLTKAQRIRVRLGGDRCILAPFPDRPKGMWRRTFQRLKCKAEDAEIRSWRELEPFLLKLERKASRL